MNRLKVAFAVLALFLGLSGCKKEDDLHISGSDYLVFGHFYGECVGETCIEIFKLEDNRLLEDVNDNYPSSTTFYNGQYKELPASKYALVSDLPEYLPSELLKTEEKVIGQPDAGDWGGLYIEYSHDGKRQYWLIDKRLDNVPTYLHDFIAKVNERITRINN